MILFKRMINPDLTLTLLVSGEECYFCQLNELKLKNIRDLKIHLKDITILPSDGVGAEEHNKNLNKSFPENS